MASRRLLPLVDATTATPQERAQHELRTPLTVIRGATQSPARSIRRSSTLAPAERAGVLARLAQIEEATTPGGRRR
jgi:signal transduction histidine kinase